MKIVLIDDSATNLVILLNLCGKVAGAECKSYMDAEQALDYLLANDVAMIIVDYSMPKVTGIELVKRLRASPRHGLTPIVMVTGSTEIAVQKRALDVGVTEFLVKPFRAADFIGCLERFLGSKNATTAVLV